MIEDKSQRRASELSQKQGNLRLASQFIRELVDRIEADKPIPESGTIVFLPSEDEPDPELSAANIRMARRFAAEGRNVILWTIGKQEPYDSGPLISSLLTDDKH